MNRHVAVAIRAGFFNGKSDIPVALEDLSYSTLIVKAYRVHTSPVLGSACLSLSCSMLVDYDNWPEDRTTYSLTPVHVNKVGKPMRWLEFTLTGQAGDAGLSTNSYLESMFISEPPLYHGGAWVEITPTEVEVKMIEEMLYFNLAQCPPGHDGTPLALAEMGTLRHGGAFACRLNVDVSVIPENAPRKKVLNMDAVIAASSTSETNPGWGDF